MGVTLRTKVYARRGEEDRVFSSVKEAAVFVNGDWFRQFRQDEPFDFLSGLKSITEEIEKMQNEIKNE